MMPLIKRNWQVPPFRPLIAEPDLLDQMAGVLKAMANDLQAEIDARYAGSQFQYPLQQRRYDTDTAIIRTATTLLSQYERHRK